MNQPKEWCDELHLEEGFTAAADELALPSEEEQVWIASTRRPLTGHKLQVVIARDEAQAKAALLKHWRRVNANSKRAQSLDAKGHCILMGFDPEGFPEAFPGLGLPVRSWEDMRVIYGAYVFPVAYGDLWAFNKVSRPEKIISDAIAYLEHPDTEDEDPLW